MVYECSVTEPRLSKWSSQIMNTWDEHSRLMPVPHLLLYGYLY